MNTILASFVEATFAPPDSPGEADTKINVRHFLAKGRNFSEPWLTGYIPMRKGEPASDFALEPTPHGFRTLRCFAYSGRSDGCAPKNMLLLQRKSIELNEIVNQVRALLKKKFDESNRHSKLPPVLSLIEFISLSFIALYALLEDTCELPTRTKIIRLC